MNKKSDWIERVNYVVAERMSNVIDNINKTRKNISQECEDHFFGEERIEFGRAQLTLMEMAGLFITYLILSLASIIVFCVEMVLARMISQFRKTKHHTNNTSIPSKTLELYFIDEYEQFRRKWMDVIVDEDTWMTHVSTQNHLCATLIAKWNEIELGDRFDNRLHVLW
jgi:hypothetical protein